MNPNGPERRDTSPMGRAIRNAVASAFAPNPCNEGKPFIESMRRCDLAVFIGGLWARAYVQGRADLAKEMRESLGSRIDEVIGEMR